MTIHTESATPQSIDHTATVLRMLDAAIEFQRPFVSGHILRARRSRPGAMPTEITRTLERQYVAAQTAAGAAVGGAAAAPGVGTGIAVALTLGEAVTSLEQSVLLTLAMAEIHGIRIDEIERRRTLVLAILLGHGGPAAVKKAAARSGKHWGRHLANSIPLDTIRHINKVLGHNFVTRYGTRQGIVVLGRVAPFGVGVAIGGVGNAVVAQGVVRGARLAFGPAPDSWPSELV